MSQAAICAPFSPGGQKLGPENKEAISGERSFSRPDMVYPKRKPSANFINFHDLSFPVPPKHNASTEELHEFVERGIGYPQGFVRGR